MALELHIWGPAFGLPSIDPESLAALSYLGHVVPPGDWSLIASNDAALSPDRRSHCPFANLHPTPRRAATPSRGPPTLLRMPASPTLRYPSSLSTTWSPTLLRGPDFTADRPGTDDPLQKRSLPCITMAHGRRGTRTSSLTSACRILPGRSTTRSAGPSRLIL